MLGFLEGLGLSTDMDVHQAAQFFADPNSRQQITGLLDARNRQLIELDGALGDIVPPTDYPHLTFMNRDESDMYAADETLDCTAYHYQNGFNAWTVPNWLTEPAFTMAYIHDGPRRLAKMGILLAQDENGPRVIVDSIETTKRITDQDASGALIAIMEGIRELQAWSDNRGFGDVFFCTYTNSSELAMELPVCRPEKAPNQLSIMADGGRHELWRLLQRQPGGHAELRPSYWQSQVDDEGAEAMIDGEDRRRNEALGHLEQILAKGGPETVDYARSGDVEGMMIAYIAANMPTIYRVFGDNVRLYKHLYKTNNLEIGDIVDHQVKELKLTDYILTAMMKSPGAKDELKSLDSGWEKGHIQWLRNNLRIQEYGLLRDEKSIRRLRQESDEARSFFEALAAVRRYGGIRDALRSIFGATDRIQSDVVLNRDLKIINRAIFETYGKPEGAS